MCASKNCVDGVCCDTSCAGPCRSCLRSYTNAADGVCTPVAAGRDPDSDCPAEAPSTCRNAGACDGAGACRRHPSGTPCAPSFCEINRYTPAAGCNGEGTCLPATTISCDRFRCSSNGCPSPAQPRRSAPTTPSATPAAAPRASRRALLGSTESACSALPACWGSVSEGGSSPPPNPPPADGRGKPAGPGLLTLPSGARLTAPPTYGTRPAPMFALSRPRERVGVRSGAGALKRIQEASRARGRPAPGLLLHRARRAWPDRPGPGPS